MRVNTRIYAFLTAILFNFLNTKTNAQNNKDYSQTPVLVGDLKLKGDTALANSMAQEYINNFLLKQKEAILFAKENLEFINLYIEHTDSKAFKLYLHEKEKVNAVLGENKAEYTVRRIIDLDFIPLHNTWRSNKPDWNLIEKHVTAEFGTLGQEAVQGKRMIYYQETKDWINFGKYYKLYFDKALKRPEYVINALSWDVFLHVNDPMVLAFAADVMKYSLETYYAFNSGAIDTYANLLYKMGKTASAIEWEEEAVKAFPGYKEFVVNLEKMKRNLPTW
jgi:hypothetical protein